MLVSFALPGQTLRVEAEYGVERLVRDVFSSGQCESIVNIRQIGNNPLAMGYFEGGENSVGFKEGIVITTGRADLAIGPNDDTDTGYAHSATPTADIDLQEISTGVLYDRAGIEFDFTPLSSTITFRYVFASEEYCDFVGREFNDVFGFFISGPGLDGPYENGAVNIARLPDSDQAVSINTVNYARNSQFYLDNEFPIVRRVSNCGGNTQRSPRFELIEYDGQTTILTATVDVQTCQTYRLRMLLADVRDRQLDSAVFLEAGSFNIGGSVTLGNAAGDDAPVVINEGCPAGEVIVRRGQDNPTNSIQVVKYRMGRPSTAREGEDIDIGGGSVTLLPGQDSVIISVRALIDDRRETDETAFLYLDAPCACYRDTVRIIVREPTAPVIGLREAFYCPGQAATLNPGVTGGIGPYTYAWSFGSADAGPTLPAPLPDDFSLTVTDVCGQTVERAISTSPGTPPSFSLPPQVLNGCQGEAIPITINLTGQGPFVLAYTLDGQPGEVRFEDSLTRTWPISEGGTYRLQEIGSAACATPLDTSFAAGFTGPTLVAELTEPTCAGDSDGTITFTHQITTGPYTYAYVGLSSDSSTHTGLTAGRYGARVTDADGCTDSLDVILGEPGRVQPPRVDCESLRRPPLDVSATGGNPPYTYSTDGEAFSDQNWLSTLSPGSYYDLYVRDAQGCEIVTTNFLWPQSSSRMVNLPSVIKHELAGSASVGARYLIPAEQITSYQWSPAELFDCPTCPSPTVSATEMRSISVVVEDIYGCRDSLASEVSPGGRVPVYVPNVFSPNGDGVNDVVALAASPTQVVRVESFRIYSRWGSLVHQAEQFSPARLSGGWDGRVGGRPAAAGAFVWVAEVLLINGNLQMNSGSIVLMR